MLNRIGACFLICAFFAADPFFSPVFANEKEKTHANPLGDSAVQTHSPSVHKGTAFWVEIVREFFKDFKLKVDQIRRIDEENELLRKRIAKLEVEVAEMKIHDLEKKESHHAAEIKEKAKHEGGVEASRTLASIDSHELPKNAQAAFEAFEKGQFGIAAKSFVQLAQKENAPLKVYFLAGVSLFKIKNYKTAQVYFSKTKALAAHSSSSNAQDEQSFIPRSMGWLALCRAKLNDPDGQTKIIYELIQKYPRSKEALRLNSRGKHES